jgi:hypothetical protein
MKRWFFFVLAAGIFTVFLTAQEGPLVLIVNNTGYTGYYLYVSPSDADEWGEDVLDEDVLPDGELLRLELPQTLDRVNRYDIQMEDEEGDTYTKWDVLITPRILIEFTLDDLD